MVLATMDSDIREFCIHTTINQMGCSKGMISTGEQILVNGMAIAHIIIACITSCNAYYIQDVGELILTSNETLGILLKFNNMRCPTLLEKTNAVKKFVKRMCAGDSATQAYSWAVNNTTVINTATYFTNNSNNNISNNSRRGGRGKYHNRGGSSRRGRGGYNQRNNNRGYNNNSGNNNNNYTGNQNGFQSNSQVSNGNNNNNGNGRNNNRNNITTPVQEFTQHFCTGPNCNHPQCNFRQ